MKIKQIKNLLIGVFVTCSGFVLFLLSVQILANSFQKEILTYVSSKSNTQVTAKKVELNLVTGNPSLHIDELKTSGLGYSLQLSQIYVELSVWKFFQNRRFNIDQLDIRDGSISVLENKRIQSHTIKESNNIEKPTTKVISASEIIAEVFLVYSNLMIGQISLSNLKLDLPGNIGANNGSPILIKKTIIKGDQNRHLSIDSNLSVSDSEMGLSSKIQLSLNQIMLSHLLLQINHQSLSGEVTFKGTDSSSDERSVVSTHLSSEFIDLKEILRIVAIWYPFDFLDEILKKSDGLTLENTSLTLSSMNKGIEKLSFHTKLKCRACFLTSDLPTVIDFLGFIDINQREGKIKLARGRFAEIDLASTQIDIGDPLDRPIINGTLHAKGQIEKILREFEKSDLLKKYLPKNIESSGEVKLSSFFHGIDPLDFRIPNFQGEIDLSKGSLARKGSRHKINRIEGHFIFDEKSLTVKSFAGILPFGNKFTLQGQLKYNLLKKERSPTQKLSGQFQGHISLNGQLAGLFDADVRPFITGGSDFRLRSEFQVGEQVRFLAQISSHLKGLGLAIPDIIDKKRDERSDFHFQVKGGENDQISAELEVKDKMAGELVLNKDQHQNSKLPRVWRGYLAKNKQIVPLQPNLFRFDIPMAEGTIKSLDEKIVLAFKKLHVPKFKSIPSKKDQKKQAQTAGIRDQKPRENDLEKPPEGKFILAAIPSFDIDIEDLRFGSSRRYNQI